MSYLVHHGIKGQKWGIRRYQNEDGSYTDAGKKRYGINAFGKMSRSGKKLYKKDTLYNRQLDEAEDRLNRAKKNLEYTKNDMEDFKKNGEDSKFWQMTWGADEHNYYINGGKEWALDAIQEGIDIESSRIEEGQKEVDRLMRKMDLVG